MYTDRHSHCESHTETSQPTVPVNRPDTDWHSHCESHTEKSQSTVPVNRTDTDVHRHSPPHRQVKTITTNCVPLNRTEWQTVTHTHSQVKKKRELTVLVNSEQSRFPSPCTGGMRHPECPSSLQTQTRSSDHHTHPSSLHIQTHT